jgi:hypothetical protein
MLWPQGSKPVNFRSFRHGGSRALTETKPSPFLPEIAYCSDLIRPFLCFQ